MSNSGSNENQYPQPYPGFNENEHPRPNPGSNQNRYSHSTSNILNQHAVLYVGNDMTHAAYYDTPVDHWTNFANNPSVQHTLQEARPHTSAYRSQVMHGYTMPVPHAGGQVNITTAAPATTTQPAVPHSFSQPIQPQDNTAGPSPTLGPQQIEFTVTLPPGEQQPRRNDKPCMHCRNAKSKVCFIQSSYLHLAEAYTVRHK